VEQHGNAATGTADGLVRDQLKVGMLVTVSANKLTGDRSLVNVIWEIAGINGGHLLLACRGLCHLLVNPSLPRLVPLKEYELYSAADFAAAVDRPSDRLN
jgi:hypothetical protein